MPFSLLSPCVCFLTSGTSGLQKDLQNTYCKQYKVLLVILSYAVIDPGAVMVHFPNAPLANAGRTQGFSHSAFHSGNTQFRRGLGDREKAPEVEFLKFLSAVCSFAMSAQEEPPNTNHHC